MCTIIAFHHVRADLPLVIAANRDELRARPGTAPVELGRAPRVWGGRDAELGGSWMGVAETGLFVGLTNQRTEQAADRTLRSRGEVVLEALRSGGMAAVDRQLLALDARRYNSFNLLYGDGRRLHVAYSRADEGSVEIMPLEAGVHVLANDRLGSPWFPKAERARKLAEPLATLPWAELRAGLARLLGDHTEPAEAPAPERVAGIPATAEIARRLQALCVHLPAYGTCSATILALEPGRVLHYGFAAGPPCSAEFADQSALLASS